MSGVQLRLQWTIIYLVVHPRARVCGLVHPSYIKLVSRVSRVSALTIGPLLR